MEIEKVRKKYPEYRISYVPKADFKVGNVDKILESGKRKITIKMEMPYEEIFIASKKRKYWLLYTERDWMTGSFKSKKKVVQWFKNGGR